MSFKSVQVFCIHEDEYKFDLMAKLSSYMKRLQWLDPSQQLPLYNRPGQLCKKGQYPLWPYCDNRDEFCKCKEQPFACNEAGHLVAILICYCLSCDSGTNATKFGFYIYNCFHNLGSTFHCQAIKDMSFTARLYPVQ